jgi:RHS repeat-associated protein
LHAVEHDGAILLQDAHGSTRIGMPAPYMVDTKPGGLPQLPSDVGPVGVSMTPVGGGLEVTYTPDQAWLHAAGRQFPVTLDPSVVSPSDVADCSLFQSAPTTSYCTGYAYTMVSLDASNKLGRTLMSFQGALAAVPADAQVTGASVYMNVLASTASNGYVVVPMTRQFSGMATWNTYDGANNWTSAGGDWDTQSYLPGGSVFGWQATGTIPASGTVQPVHFDVTPMTQSWLDGSRSVPSLMISENFASANNYFTIQNHASGAGPYMQITYTPRLGSPSGAAVEQTKLSDRMSLGVNVGNGNVMVNNNDLQIAGRGLGLSVPRTFNNLSASVNSFGYGWGTQNGLLPYIGVGASDALYMVTPDGGYSVWDADPANALGVISPPGMDAYMCQALTQSGCPNLISGAVLQVIFRSGERWEFAVVGNLYRLIADIDKNGNRITYTYNSSGQPSGSTDTQGRTTTYAYSGPFISTITDNAGARTLGYTVASTAALTVFTDAAGKQTHYYNDASGNMIDIIDPAGETTVLTYGANNRVTSIKRVTNNSTGAGDTTTYAYGGPTGIGGVSCNQTSQAPNPITYGSTLVTDPNGHKTVYCYDTHDRVIEQIDPMVNRTAYSSDLNDNVTNTVQPTGGTFKSLTDGSSSGGCFRPSSSVAPPTNSNPTTSSQTYLNSCTGANASSAATFEPNTAVDPQQHTTNYAYDPNGNLTSIVDPLAAQNTTTIDYQRTSSCTSDCGIVDFTVDADLNRTNYGYDGVGNLTSVTPPAPLVATSATYDAVSRQSTATDGNGKQTVFNTYDALDRLTKETHPDASTTTYTYDADGNLLTQVDSSTGTSTYTPDLKNRVTNETSPGVTNTYGYDGADNLTSVQDAGGTVVYGYDIADRLTSVKEPGYTTPNITFTPDADGRRVCTTYPGGVVVQNGYDESGALLSTKAANGGAVCNPSDPNGTPSGGTVFSNYLYNYVAGGTETALRQSLTINSGSPFAYAYDKLNRLTTVTNQTLPHYPLNYTYDGDGNLKTKSNVDGTSKTLTYNAANQITNTGSLCDGAGNMTARPDPGGTTSLGYNTRNQTTSLNPDGTGALTWSYLGDGQSKPTQIGNTPLLGSAPPLLTTNTLGISSAAIPLLGSASVTYYTRDPGGALLGQRTPSNGNYYNITDANGSVIAITNSSGVVANTYTYDPWGQTTNTTTCSSPCVPASNSFGFDQGFQSTGGLYHYGARYYDPGSGSWTQQDPVLHLTDPSQIARYTYAGDNPVNTTDPNGTSRGCPAPAIEDPEFPDYARPVSCEGSYRRCVGGAPSGGRQERCCRRCFRQCVEADPPGGCSDHACGGRWKIPQFYPTTR